MAVCEAIKQGNAKLRARMAQKKAPVRPIYLKDEQKCEEPEKPYRILRPERLTKCTHERNSFLIDRKPWDMTEHFQVHQKSRRDKQCPDDKFRVYQLIHPPPRRYKGCRHHDNVIVDRDSLSPQEHLDILARPMKRETPPQVYKLIPKFISPCTLRIKQLALPTKQLVLATWQQHAHHLPVDYIQNFRKTLHTTKFIETAEALEHIKQLKRDERQRRLNRKLEIRGLRRKLARKHEREMREVMRVIFDETKDMFLSGQPPRLTEEMARMSEYVDKNLRKFIDFEAYAAAATAPRFVLEKFLQNVADKLVYWAMSFLKVAGVSLEDFPRETTAEADSFASLFDLPPDQQPYLIDDYIALDTEASLSTLEESSEVEPEVEVLAEDFTENAESEEVESEVIEPEEVGSEEVGSEEVGSERVEEEAEPDEQEVLEPKPSTGDIEEAESEGSSSSEGSHQSLDDTVKETTATAARRSSQMSDFVRRSVQKLEHELNPEDEEQK